MRVLLSYVLWPGLLAGAIAVNAYGMTTGMPLVWLNVSYFGLAVALFVLERAMPHELLSKRPHTHNARDDAVEQADLFANLFEWRNS